MNVTQVTVYSLRSISEQLPCVAKWRKTQMTSDMTTALQECRGHAEDTHRMKHRVTDADEENQSRHYSAGSLPTSFIRLKSPKGVHYFQSHEVIIWVSINTGGQKFSKVFMFLDFKQQNNQKNLR